MAEDKGAQRNPPGPIGENVIANVEALRKDRQLSYEALAAKLAEIGHPMNPVSLSRLGRGERRVGADDLVAIAIVLGVNVSALLLPRDAHDDAEIQLTPAIRQRFALAWQWADGELPVQLQPVTEEEAHAALRDFQRHARPHQGARDSHPLIAATRRFIGRVQRFFDSPRGTPEDLAIRLSLLDTSEQEIKLELEDLKLKVAVKTTGGTWNKVAPDGNVTQVIKPDSELSPDA